MLKFKKAFNVLGFQLVWWLFALSYIASNKFGALNFTPAFFSLTVLVVFWGMAVPFLYLLNQKIAKAK
jgi:hypothetical protein